MRPQNRREGPPRRACRPSLEGLEARDLPSVAAPPASATQTGAGLVQALGTVNRPTDTLTLDPALIPGFLKTLYSPITTTVPIQIGNQVFPPGTYPVPQPTTPEIQRESIVEKFVGRYYIGAPRFSNQAATIHIYSDGRNVVSNQFLNARAEILLVTPADPTAKPTTNDPAAGQINGLITTFPANYLQSSSNLFMDVTNLPGVASNDPNALDHGLPSRLAWTWDPVSGGLYASPQFASNPPVQTAPMSSVPIPVNPRSLGSVGSFNGTGVLDIQYLPDAHPKPGSLGSGAAVVTLQGLINTTGATYSLAKPIN
jgi:hypothetical protein